MKYIVFIICFLLSGCYLANGPPDSLNYWVKDGGKAPYKHFKYCDDFSRSKMDNHYFYLENKFYNSTSNKREDDEFMKLYRKKNALVNQCLYDIGYRFRPPLLWCLAEGGNNTKICIENMKYRN
ncbi:hypothetical protein IO48_02745 [Gallibacterium anatis 4895]|uniref:Lipoprotein n=1 Tax=Gallibacterium anatis 4895 TaxID=1396510 RepID=A0A0A3A5I0_9PAST|nr:hypothetical protein IO48_02745 [Gallibacterium anatis 4895]